MADQGRESNGDDPFANFSYNPPKPVGHFRSFTNRSRYKMLASMTASSGKQLGSNTSLSSLSGSLSSLMDPAKLMSMQEDAHSRKISSEVMKQCLYESVIASPYRRQRRLSMRPNDYRGLSSSTYGGTGDNDNNDDRMSYSRMVQSMPVTPAQSQTVTPAVSPTTLRRFRAFTSRCGTPDESNDRSLGVTEDSWKGLASLFKPCPRYISASRGGVMSRTGQGLDTLFDDLCEPESMELGGATTQESVIKLDAPPRGHHHHRPT